VSFRGGSRGGSFGGFRGGSFVAFRGGSFGGFRGGSFVAFRGGSFGGFRRVVVVRPFFRPFVTTTFFPSWGFYQPFWPVNVYSDPSFCAAPFDYSSYYGISGGPQFVPASPLGDLPQIPQVGPYQGNQPFSPVPLMPRAPAGEPGNGTFDYDGGPGNSIPLPGNNFQQSVPKGNPQPAKAATGERLVSFPAEAPKAAYQFRAYGELAPTTTPTRSQGATTPVSLPSTGFAFPAYGEQPGTTGFATKR
jgi:hypothetical protein